MDHPEHICALPLGESFVPDTLHEQQESAFGSNTYPDLQLSCRLRQYWKINSSFSVFCAQILMFTKIKDDKAEGRNLCRTSTDAARGSGARYGLIFAKLPNSNTSIDINCSFAPHPLPWDSHQAAFSLLLQPSDPGVPWKGHEKFKFVGGYSHWEENL